MTPFVHEIADRFIRLHLSSCKQLFYRNIQRLLFELCDLRAHSFYLSVGAYDMPFEMRYRIVRQIFPHIIISQTEIQIKSN